MHKTAGKRTVSRPAMLELGANDPPADLSAMFHKMCMPRDREQYVRPLPTRAHLEPQWCQHTEKYWKIQDLKKQLALLQKDDNITQIFNIPIVEPLQQCVLDEALQIVNNFGGKDWEYFACESSASDTIMRARKVYLFINHCARQAHTNWNGLCTANPMYHHAYTNLLSLLSPRDRLLMEVFQQEKMLE